MSHKKPIIIIIIIIIIYMTILSDIEKHRTEENRKEKQVQRPRTRNRENVADENRSVPCGFWCTWYSKGGDGGKRQESIRESYCDRDQKDLLAGICTNPQEGAK